MKGNKKIIYFPSFSSMASLFIKDEQMFPDSDNPVPFRFYSDKFPEKYRTKNFLIPAGGHLKDLTIRERMKFDDECTILGDSGGFQIANNTLQYTPELKKQVFNWLERNSDFAMNLDIPPRIKYAGKFNECLDISVEHFKYFEQNQTGKTKYLNVIQAEQPSQYKTWYDRVKGFEFNGWGIGSAKNVANLIYAFAVLLDGKEFEKKSCNLVHVLGRTKPSDFLLYTFFQKKLNERYDHIQISTDSSSPIQYSVYGQYLHSVNWKDLTFTSAYFGNKGKTQYVGGNLPCTVPDCPVCSRITFDDIAKGDQMGRYYTVFHMLFVYLDTIEKCTDLTHAHIDLMDGVIDRKMFQIIKTIDELFDSDKPLKTYDKYRALYESYKETDDFSVTQVQNEFFDFN